MTDTPPPLPAPEKKLSLTSFWLGLVSIVPCSIFTGIPAIITGHIALNRATREPQRYGGKGMAAAGLAMGYLSIGIAIVALPAGLLLPALGRAKERAQRSACVNNMKQIGLAARIYAADNGDKFPPSFIAMSNELNTPKILTCQADKPKTRSENWQTFTPAQISYEFLTPSLDEARTPYPVPAFRCPIHKSIGFSDGSVQAGPAIKGSAGISGD